MKNEQSLHTHMFKSELGLFILKLPGFEFLGDNQCLVKLAAIEFRDWNGYSLQHCFPTHQKFMVKTIQTSFPPSPNFDRITVSFDKLNDTDIFIQCNG